MLIFVRAKNRSQTPKREKTARLKGKELKTSMWEGKDWRRRRTKNMIIGKKGKKKSGRGKQTKQRAKKKEEEAENVRAK